MSSAIRQTPESPPNVPTLTDAANSALKDGNDLTPLLTLRAHQAAYTQTPDLSWEYWQYLSVCESRVGNYAEALKCNSAVQARQLGGKPVAAQTEADRRANQTERNRLAAYAPRDAVAAIAEAARSRRVVMINEAHHVPQHRVFTARLLSALYKQGYRWFAAETLYAQDADLNRRGFPTRKTGFYTAEPLYAELVRAALRMGYHVVAYEAEGKGDMKPGMTRADMRRAQDARERGQAENLIQRVFRQDPKAKLLVHVGYGHASKRRRAGAGFQLMGRHFRELSGLNALSVDQTEMSEAGTPQEESALYRAVADKLTVPVVYRRGGHRNDCFVRGSAKSGYDMQVFHPRSHYAQGRPDWLARETGRIPVHLPPTAEQAASGQETVLVRAYVPREWEAASWQAIPADQILLESNKPVPILMLSPGAYRLQLWTAGGETLYDAPLVVAPVKTLAGAQNPLLADELNKMAETDQEVRNRWIKNQSDKTIIAEMRRIDAADIGRMKQIVAQYGWPGRTLVGRESAFNAWLLVQHADQDHAFQKQCLVLMQKAVANGEASKSDFALLTDRVLRAESKKQRYGTQFLRTTNGKLVMQPTEDEPHLDQRRKRMGLPPIAEYAKALQEMYNPEKPDKSGESAPSLPTPTPKSDKP